MSFNTFSWANEPSRSYPSINNQINDNYFGGDWENVGKLMIKTNVPMYLKNYREACIKLAEARKFYHGYSKECHNAEEALFESEKRLLDAIAAAIYETREAERAAAEEYKKEISLWMRDAYEADNDIQS